MLAQIPEKYMHNVRWVIAGGWLLLILSLFYDPFTIKLTEPNTLWSPFHISENACVEVQGSCVVQNPYSLGN
jgi:hypothetical protein